MTVVIIVGAILLFCAVVTVMVLWYERRRPVNDVDLRLEAVDAEMKAAVRGGFADSYATPEMVNEAPGTTGTIPRQRTARIPRPQVTRKAQIGKPGSAA